MLRGLVAGRVGLGEMNGVDAKLCIVGHGAQRDPQSASFVHVFQPCFAQSVVVILPLSQNVRLVPEHESLYFESHSTPSAQ
jgi:hypothetical protein